MASGSGRKPASKQTGKKSSGARKPGAVKKPTAAGAKRPVAGKGAGKRTDGRGPTGKGSGASKKTSAARSTRSTPPAPRPAPARAATREPAHLTPAQLDALLDRAEGLLESDPGRALDSIDEAASQVPPAARGDEDAIEREARLLNLRGLCLGALGRHQDAIVDFQRACDLGDDYAALNLIETWLNDRPDLAAALEEAERLRGRQLDEHCRFHVENYIAQLRVLRGEAEVARGCYERLLELYGERAPARIEESRARLAELASREGAPATLTALATELLDWFRPAPGQTP